MVSAVVMISSRAALKEAKALEVSAMSVFSVMLLKKLAKLSDESAEVNDSRTAAVKKGKRAAFPTEGDEDSGCLPNIF